MSKKIILLFLCFIFEMLVADVPLGTRLWDIAKAELEKTCTIESKVDLIDETDRVIESKVCVLDSKIEKIAQDMLCTPTVVTTAGTITTPGSYCLANDISGVLTIDSPRVVFDLNGHQILGGISLTGNASEIFMLNGFIDGNGTTNGIEMPVGGITDVHIHNVTISNAARGIDAPAGMTRLFITDTIVVDSLVLNLNLVSCDDVWIERCMFNNSISIMIFNNNVLSSCTNVHVTHSSFDNNSNNAFVLFACTDVYIAECSFDNNGGNAFTMSSQKRATIVDSTFNNNRFGFFTLSGPGNRCYEIIRCTASENTNEGFLLTNTFVCIDCIACGNGTEGFQMNSNAGSFCMEGCVAKANDTGFLAVSGVEGIVKECMAVGNTSCGFDDATAATAVTYGANVAKLNGTGNY